MIRFENRFDEYAYRIAYRDLDDSVTSLLEGQWVTVVGGKLVKSDGTLKSFITTASIRDGRDLVSGRAVRKAAYLFGTYELSVDQFDVQATYGDMVPLVVNADSILTPQTTEADHLIVAYSIGEPANGFLRICSK